MPSLKSGGLEITIERDRAPEPKGPEAVASEAARRFTGGDANGRSPDDLEAIDRATLSQGTRCARLFKFSIPEDARAWAELRQQHFSSGLVKLISVKELISGTDYAQFMEWVEFKKPEEEVRATVVQERDAFLDKVKPKEPVAKAPEKKPRRTKKAAQVEVVPPMDLPATHQALEDPK